MYFTAADQNLVSVRSFEDEIVIANFGTGIYYSLSNAAAEIWRGLLASFSTSEIIAKLAPHVTGDAEQFADRVKAFVFDLHAAQLIQLTAERTREPWEPVAPAEGWTRPQLESFSDMQDLLLLDPVHDTSEAGWPYVVNA